jgi:hypothetical protein
MSKTIQAEIAKQKERGIERVKETGEVFTPLDLCKKMIRGIPTETLKNPNSTYLDHSCGDGNFLISLLEVLTEEYGHERNHVLNNQLYGVDLMPDNIAAVRERLGIEPGTPSWDHIVCADALKYNFEFAPSEI